MASISGEAFILTWNAGGFGDDPEQPALLRVAMSRPVGHSNGTGIRPQLRRRVSLRSRV